MQVPPQPRNNKPREVREVLEMLSQYGNKENDMANVIYYLHKYSYSKNPQFIKIRNCLEFVAACEKFNDVILNLKIDDYKSENEKIHEYLKVLLKLLLELMEHQENLALFWNAGEKTSQIKADIEDIMQNVESRRNENNSVQFAYMMGKLCWDLGEFNVSYPQNIFALKRDFLNNERSNHPLAVKALECVIESVHEASNCLYAVANMFLSNVMKDKSERNKLWNDFKLQREKLTLNVKNLARLFAKCAKDPNGTINENIIDPLFLMLEKMSNAKSRVYKKISAKKKDFHYTANPKVNDELNSAVDSRNSFVYVPGTKDDVPPWLLTPEYYDAKINKGLQHGKEVRPRIKGRKNSGGGKGEGRERSRTPSY
jgi:hypothetical protein